MMIDDEIWTTRDGRKIAVGDMEESHVRNALRMLLRARRKKAERLRERYDDDIGDGQDLMNAQCHRDLANPNAYFPLLEGGVHGSPDLQKRYG